MSFDNDANWDAQLDNCLINAAGVLAGVAPPSTVDEACQLAAAWMSLADAWNTRLDTEDNFIRWVAEAVTEEPVAVE